MYEYANIYIQSLGHLRNEEISFSLVCPAFIHQYIHSIWTCCRTLHAAASFNEAHHVRSFHFLNNLKKGKSCNVIFNPALALVWFICTNMCHLPCMVSLRRKRPPTWWYQNSTHHFCWRTCGSLYILGRTISKAIYLPCEPVKHNTYIH